MQVTFIAFKFECVWEMKKIVHLVPWASDAFSRKFRVHAYVYVSASQTSSEIIMEWGAVTDSPRERFVSLISSGMNGNIHGCCIALPETLTKRLSGMGSNDSSA